MTHPSVHVQIAPTSVPSTPSWLGEVAVVAHVFSQLGLQKAIEERVRFVRARMGDYEVIDFVVMLIGYAVSGERTLQSFYQRLLPFAEPFMALFGRANLPHPATLSRFLAALDQAPVEALRTLFRGAIWWRGLRSLLFFRSSSVQCAFTLHKQLLISSFHGTLPFFPFMKMSLSLLLSACFHLVAYLVGPGKSFRMP